MDSLQLLSQALRGAIVAPPGKLLFVADYSGIEARVLLWCAQDTESLELFRQGRCIYMDFASSIFGYPVTDKKKQKMERQFGKVGILGLGYQCGIDKFVDVAWALGGIVLPRESKNPNDITSVKVVGAYREKYYRVKQLWYDMETAAGEATFDKEGTVHECYPVKWFKEGRFLYCELPSGRRLAYADPKIKMMDTSWGARKNTLTFMGVNPKTRKWMRQTTYGGSLVENIVQAISRDLLGESLVRCEESKVYVPILTVHDEIIAEGHKDHGNQKEFESLIAQVPTWAPGLPIAVEGFAAARYRK